LVARIRIRALLGDDRMPTGDDSCVLEGVVERALLTNHPRRSKVRENRTLRHSGQQTAPTQHQYGYRPPHLTLYFLHNLHKSAKIQFSGNYPPYFLYFMKTTMLIFPR
jgi:hypothetical protein